VVRMKIGVCGIACEACPRMAKGICPNRDGCRPKDNPMCKIATCAFQKGVDLCFNCPPSETTRAGPISYGYCMYISGKELGQT